MCTHINGLNGPNSIFDEVGNSICGHPEGQAWVEQVAEQLTSRDHSFRHHYTDRKYVYAEN